MNSSFRFFSALVVTSALGTCQHAFAQSDSAESLQAWQALQRQAYSYPARSSDTNSTRAQLANAARTAATAAKSYYTTYPTSAKASEARKLEVVLGLKGVTDGDAAYETSVQNLAKKFRSDSGNSEQDRFEVACLADSVADRAKLSRNGVRNGREVEAFADKLLAEFSDLASAYEYYANLASAVDMDTGAEMAGKLLQSSASADVKHRAQEMIDRRQLVGTTPSFALTTVDGTAVDLTKTSGKWTVVYACSPWAIPTSIAWMQGAKHPLSSKVQFVFLTVGEAVDVIKSATEKVSIPGALCAEPSPLAAVSATSVLKIRRQPWVYVFDDSGKLQGFGPPDQLPALIPAAIQ